MSIGLIKTSEMSTGTVRPVQARKSSGSHAGRNSLLQASVVLDLSDKPLATHSRPGKHRLPRKCGSTSPLDFFDSASTPLQQWKIHSNPLRSEHNSGQSQVIGFGTEYKSARFILPATFLQLYSKGEGAKYQGAASFLKTGWATRARRTRLFR